MNRYLITEYYMLPEYWRAAIIQQIELEVTEYITLEDLQ